MELKDFKNTSGYTEVCEEIIQKEGVCGDITCRDCPFTSTNNAIKNTSCVEENYAKHCRADKHDKVLIQSAKEFLKMTLKTKARTRPLNLLGCNEEIAENLCNGLATEVGDNEWCSGFNSINAKYLVINDWDSDWHMIATPYIRKEQVVKGKKELIQQLLDDGYLPTIAGHWRKDGCTIFRIEMFDYCGKNPVEASCYWMPQWLEEEQ